jgi:VRR-NUC domain-containing protein
MSHGGSKFNVAKLMRAIGELPQPGMNKAEERFVWALTRKYPGAKATRSGWPDFLVQIPGRAAIAVEVKSRLDVVSARQAVMFQALEAAGIAVFVWDPREPEVLKPWRKRIDLT